MKRDDIKVRILAVERMLSKDRYITTTEILRRLELRHDIKVDRKRVYDDLRAIDLIVPLDVKVGIHGGYKIMVFEE